MITGSEPTSMPASANFAVAVCNEAWTRAHKAAMTSNMGRIHAAQVAADAYRRAMPTLSCAEKITDFIACVAHGMLINAISGSDGARLLYAAQVASSVLRGQPARQKPAA